MPAIKLMCQTLGINPGTLSKEEIRVLEADLFSRICEELKEIYRNLYKNYFRLMKLSTELENTIMETSYVRCVVNDILTTEEYSLTGLACYTHAPEDVIFEIATGINTDPAVSLVKKIIDLHRMVRPELYKEIMNKIIGANLKLN